ncbi:PAS domain-containing sensor histidine kinase [Larkinella soli]|uniref:PAS domain-containing sensor histidine kinase n=1 Tax=Larkinella soli TaxID=1770527 RepID=UPI000FFB83B0|nr:PAS domain-containing sensor histidine kinase [Larkinella soli]
MSVGLTSEIHSSLFLETLLRSSQDGIVVFRTLRDQNEQGVDFRAVQANKTACRILGQNPEQLFQLTLRQQYPHPLPAALLRILEAVVRSGSETAAETFSPQDRPAMELTATPWADGALVFLAPTVRPTGPLPGHPGAADRTAELQATNDLLTGILDCSMNGVLACEPVFDTREQITDFRITLANQPANGFLGLPETPLVGSTIKSIYPEAERNGLYGHLLITARTGQAGRFDHFYHREGYNAWFDFSVTRHRGGIVLSFADITELKRSNQSLEQFAYVASHDLQEPLRKIQSFGEVLTSQYRPLLDDAGADLINRMHQAANRMQTLVRDLLSYSRLSTQKEPFQVYALSGIVGEVLSDLDVALKEKKAIIDVDPLPEILGDGLQLRQLVQNLISNALKFTYPDSTPYLRIGSRRVGRAELPTEIRPVGMTVGPESFWQIDFTDNGIGFDEKYLDRIFTIFQRLHGRSQYSGTGIGLAICKKVVDNHRGYITASSRPGEGATFRVFLPA